MAKRQPKTALNPAQNTARIEAMLMSINSTLMSRDALIRKLLDTRRDIDDECGYSKDLTIDDYRQAFDRDAVANRVVSVVPEESWQRHPEVYEEESPDEETDFERAWDSLGKSLRGDSFFHQEQGSAVWEYLLRADILSGIGSYGVILLGIDDGLPLDKPVAGVVKYPEGSPLGTDAQYAVNAEDETETLAEELDMVDTPRKLLYLRVFDQSTAKIVQRETNAANPRYGMPTMYQLTFDEPAVATAGIPTMASNKNVHWSRIIHVADSLMTSEFAGKPRLEAIWNRVYDLMKTYGGGAEGYWRGAYNGLSFETHPTWGPDADIDVPALQDKIENMRNGLQRDIFTQGMTAKSIAPNVLDPSPWIKVYLEAICIKIGVPMRVFLGSERGELASSQDDSAWNDRLAHRQNFYLTPRLIVPFVDRLILIGVLPKPKAGYCVKWPDLNTTKPIEKADVGLKRTQSIVAYVQGNGEALLEPVDFLTKVLGFTDEEAESIIENVMERLAGEEDDGETSRLTPDPEAQQQSQLDAQLKQLDAAGTQDGKPQPGLEADVPPNAGRNPAGNA